MSEYKETSFEEKLKTYPETSSSSIQIKKKDKSVKNMPLSDTPPGTFIHIDENATNLFNDKEALYSYIKKFEPKKTLARLYELEKSFGNCHDTAHFVGRFAYDLYSAESFRKCGMVCQSGCYHGAVEAFFRDHGTANLSTNLNKLCTDDLNPFILHQCLHGIGHGLLAWTNYELFDALKSCDLLKSGQSSCHSGVFMENIVQSMAKFLGLEGHVTDYVSNDPHYPCNILDEKYKPTCYFLQTDRIVQIFGSDFAKVASVCAEVTHEPSRRSCFQSMGRTVGGHNRGNPSGAIADCSKAPQGDARNNCISGAVQDTFWDPSGQDIALTFCRLLENDNEKDVCYNIIFERAPQVLASQDEIKNFCAKAEASYQDQCMRHSSAL